MTKYTNWQQKKKNNRRCLYLPSLQEEMVTPQARRRAGSGNVNRHTHRAMTAMGVACKQPASATNVKKTKEYGVQGALVVQQLMTEKDWKCCQCLE